jgi:hypothetical protein
VTHGRHPLHFTLVILALLLLSGVAHAAGPDGSAVPAAIDSAESEALQWLFAQVVPNDTVPAPDPGRRRLILSYQVPSADPDWRFISGRSFLYDDALAVVALTMLGKYREAEFLLNALGRLVMADGTLWFAYNTQNSWPDASDHEGALIRSGALAWAGYAFTYYVGARVREDPSFATRDPLGIEYLRAARSLASALLASRITDRNDPRFGLVTGGRGSSTVGLDYSSSRPVERYSPAKVQWVSTEHNIDSWFFLRDLARLLPEPELGSAADLVRARLELLWNGQAGQFMQGIHEDAAMDTELPLDCASWGALFLGAQGRAEQALRCAASMRARFSSEANGVRGYRPYAREQVYQNRALNRFFYPGDPGKRWQDLPFVWGEGSLGAAAALIRTGDRDAGLRTIEALLPMAVGGGFRYATDTVPYQFSSYPSVAATAWFVIAVEMLRGTPAAQSFWGP